MAPDWHGESRPRVPLLTTLRDPSEDRVLDHALVTYFEAPASYTGEDLIEISTHGGVLVPALVLSALESAGARGARAGEFTQRAYLNGKLDLVQAEGIRDLIDAGSDAGHQVALHQMEGGLSGRLAKLREQLVALEAMLVYHLDFPEEDEPPVPLAEILQAGEVLCAALQDLLSTAPEGELIKEGALVVLAGRPNAGKSSLFNALLGVERAIVTAQPGTTRDALEASVSFEGYPFRMVDTAGLRERAEEVERLGIEVARRYVRHAEVVLLCVSMEWGWGDPETAFLRELGMEKPVIVLQTKADRGSHKDDPDVLAPRERAGLRPPTELAQRIHAALEVSVIDGRGLGELRRVLKNLVFRGVITGGGLGQPLLTRRRQTEGVRLALRETQAFVEALEEGLPADVAATHLRPAETALEELLGIVSPDEILDRVFADFCVGK